MLVVKHCKLVKLLLLLITKLVTAERPDTSNVVKRVESPIKVDKLGVDRIFNVDNRLQPDTLSEERLVELQLTFDNRVLLFKPKFVKAAL